jgi:high-affinity K+ transport system ATPase subunit B
LILQTFPTLAERDVVSTTMGDTGADIKLSAAAFSKFPYSVECKNQEANKALLKMFAQSTAHSNKDGGTPLVVISANHEDVLCILRFKDFLKVVGENVHKTL